MFTQSPRASADLDDIFDTIADENPSAAERTIRRINSTCRDIAHKPDMGRAWTEIRSSLRGYPLGKYIIFYLPADIDIHVLRVVTSERDLDTLFHDPDEHSED